MKAPTELINFQGSDWVILKQHLTDIEQSKIGLLVGTLSHDDSNKIRGAIQTIRSILALEKDAERKNRPQP